MTAKVRKVHFENTLDRTVYVLLRTNDGTGDDPPCEPYVEIHLYDRPYSNACGIGSMMGISFTVDAELEKCIHGGRLAFLLEGHLSGRGRFAVVPGGMRREDGPIFSIEPVESAVQH